MNIISQLLQALGVQPSQLISPIPQRDFQDNNDVALQQYYQRELMADQMRPQQVQYQPQAVQYNPAIANAPQNPFADFTTAKVPQELQNIILQSAAQYKIDPNVFASLLFSEHGFNTKDPGINRNPNGTYDRGVAQLNSGTVPDDSVALDPNRAIPKAAEIFSNYINQTGGLQRGILAYNHGVTGQKYIRIPQTDTYYKKVTAGLTPTLKQRIGL